MTQTKRLESQLRQSKKMESIGTLAGGIAHDFNNILSIIMGNTELAIDDIPEWNPAHEYLVESRIACIRAKELIKQLLGFSRKSDENLMLMDICPAIPRIPQAPEVFTSPRRSLSSRKSPPNV